MGKPPPKDPEELRRTPLVCPGCGWKGTGADAVTDAFGLTVCPECGTGLEVADEDG